VTLDGLGRVGDADVLALVPRVEVHADPIMAQRLCRLQLHLFNGQILTAFITKPVGQPDFEEVSSFARALAPEMGAPLAAVDRLIAAVAGLHHAPDTRELMAATRDCVPVSP
jgi:hypothetical protein